MNPWFNIDRVTNHVAKTLSKIKQKVEHKRDATTGDVGDVMVLGTVKAEEEIRQKMDYHRKELVNLEQREIELHQSYKKVRDNIKNIATLYDSIKIHKSKLRAHYKKAAERLKQDAPISGFEIDKKGRIIVRTEPLEVQRKGYVHWIGRYKIRIDFFQPYYKIGINVINIDRGFNGKDHPCIENGLPCYGSIGREIKESFMKGDLYQLVIDVLAFLVSPKVDLHNPYVCWDDFLSRATPRFRWDFDEEKLKIAVAKKIANWWREDKRSSIQLCQYLAKTI